MTGYVEALLSRRCPLCPSTVCSPCPTCSLPTTSITTTTHSLNFVSVAPALIIILLAAIFFLQLTTLAAMVYSRKLLNSIHSQTAQNIPLQPIVFPRGDSPAVTGPTTHTPITPAVFTGSAFVDVPLGPKPASSASTSSMTKGSTWNALTKQLRRSKKQAHNLDF
uniref:Uncharacterized protein n=1 Tax=Acrobeloides nanus TaxID=290746 RepID=A0A914E8P3_9BILA